jgi:DNA-binding IclR family transcriptional regulator
MTTKRTSAVRNKNVKSASSKNPVLRDVPAVSKAVAILRFLARAESPIGVVAVAREVGAIPSTCLHILRVLVNEGLAAFDPVSKKYTLGAGILSLASTFSHRNPFVQVVRSSLEELSRKHRCAFAALEQSDAEHMVVVAVGDIYPGISVRVTTGTRLPILMSASGRCFAAFGKYSPADLKRRFGRLRWDNPPNFDEWLAQIEEVRKQGHAIDAGHYIRGVSVVAVPVFDGQRTALGCITTVDFREKLTGDRLKAVIADMADAADEAGWKLGGGTKSFRSGTGN